MYHCSLCELTKTPSHTWLLSVVTAEADKESDGEEVLLVAVLAPSLSVVVLIILLVPVMVVGWRLMKRYAPHFSTLKFRVAYNIQFNNSFFPSRASSHYQQHIMCHTHEKTPMCQ